MKITAKQIEREARRLWDATSPQLEGGAQKYSWDEANNDWDHIRPLWSKLAASILRRLAAAERRGFKRGKQFDKDMALRRAQDWIEKGGGK